MTDHLLQLGALDLTAAGMMAWSANPLAGGFSLGAPVPVVDALPHLLLDGEIVSGKRSSNREIKFFVEVRGDDVRSLAEAEVALIAEVDKPNLLWWKPPGLNTPTTEFQTFRGSCVPQPDDLKELRGVRVYEVTLPAMPFGRSTSETIVEALPATPTVPTTTVLTSGASTTGWSAGVTAGTASVDLPQTSAEQLPYDPVRNQPGNVVHIHEATFTPAAPVAADGTALMYVVLRTKTYIPDRGSQTEPPIVTVNGVVVDETTSEYVADGYYDFFYLGRWTTINSVKVRLRIVTPAGDFASGAAPVSLLKITNGDVSSTARQQLRTFSVGGSVRAPGTIQIDHETSGLGDVVVYTDPSLNTTYRPDLMRWLNTSSSGSPAAGSVGASVSGAPRLTAFGVGQQIFDIPAESLPEGGYVLLARVGDAAGSALTVTTSTRLGSVDVATDTYDAAIPEVASGEFKIVALATMTLPPAPTRTGTVRVVIDAPGEPNFILDELWLFYMGEDSALSIVSCGAGTPALGSVHNRLDLSAASTNRVMPSVWVGTAVDRADFFHAGTLASDIPAHIFTPPTTRAFVVTPGADNPSVAYRYKKTWHTFAAED